MAASRVLVTGGAGFIGSHLARALIADGSAVDVADDLSTGRREDVPPEADFIEIDLGAAGTLEKAFAGRSYDAICHVAGQASGEKSFDDPARDLDSNARSTVALAAWALEQRVPVLLHASSMGVYGQPERSPVGEGDPTLPLSWYGASKLAAERALSVAAGGGLRTVSLRMFSIYGQGQDLADLRQGMVSIFLAMALRDEPIVVRGPLDRKRDFVFIDDCVEAWLRALRAEAVSGPLNVGTGTGTSIEGLLRELRDALGRPEHPVEVADVRTPGDQYALWADTARMREQLDWTPATPLREGLDAMVRWAADGG